MREHPSNRLYNGECETLEQALKLCEQEFQWELNTMPVFEDDEPGKGEEDRLLSSLQQTLEEIQALRKEYRAAMDAVERELMMKWHERKDTFAYDVADAYFLGDYSSLAI